MDAAFAEIKDIMSLERAIKGCIRKRSLLDEEIHPVIIRLKEQGLLNVHNCASIGMALINGTYRMRDAGNPYAAVTYSLALEEMCRKLGIDSATFEERDFNKVSYGALILNKVREFLSVHRL